MICNRISPPKIPASKRVTEIIKLNRKQCEIFCFGKLNEFGETDEILFSYRKNHFFFNVKLVAQNANNSDSEFE